MKNEFNPEKKDLLLIEGLILNIKNKRNDLITRKMNLQNSLSVLKDKYKEVNFNSNHFYKIKNTRQNIKNHLSGIENRINALNSELVFKQKLKLEIEHYLKNNKVLDIDGQKIINSLLVLKSKYIEFTKDRTRIASLRVMAAEFITEIEKIIKP